jgi:hypothetical protein|tara:strand:+ start:1055 stop:1243 length:189 start_codon:yes stop_codon:yes gene_type:complete
MKTLVFVLVILEGTQIYDESLQYGSIDKCNWYANKINFYNERQTRNTYSAYCKPLVIEKNEE